MVINLQQYKKIALRSDIEKNITIQLLQVVVRDLNEVR